MEKEHYSVLFIVIGFLQLSHGCSIEGIDNWLVPQSQGILDTFKGILFSGATENIQAITNVVQREGLIGGPYIKVSLENSLFIISTDAAFENYEDIETQTTLGYTITLRCTDSSVRTLVFIINITDTNNNDPIFLPTNKYEFTIAPPVPPGFLVTTCLNDILVRDIDLTTQRIDFKIEGSDLFEIAYDPSSSVAKEFKAILKTTNLIRSIPEPISLTVTATDVDLTADPPRSATATVVISADSQFQFPDEPIFSQPFYLATYKIDNDVILQNTIFLSQGFDDEVKFTFESDYSEYFQLVINKNNLSFNMKAPIPISLYEEGQIYLVVIATREHTSGATATIVLKLPEDIPLEFENAIYEGTITDNVLQLTDLRLKQGYEGLNITVDIKSEYNFRADIEANVIKISMDPLVGDDIQTNFINLQILASNNRTTAIAVVTLEIIKDDNITPVFENNLYSGSYSTELGLTLEQIVLTQGYDITVKIALEGKYIEYFKTTQDGPKITLTSSTIPSDIFDERNIMISVLASKPRTVGAHAVVNIALPEARYLDFESDIYEGSIENNNITLNTIVMTDGYASDINFTLSGEFMTYFSAKNDQNLVTINIVKEIPESVLSENDFLVFVLSASGTNAIPTSTSIVLQVIKEDLRTPVFSENLYSFKYENDELSLENIELVQGFDETVKFDLIGDHREYFFLEQNLNSIKLTLKSSIPKDVIFNEKFIILNIVARKYRTVGANTAVYITFPQEMIEPIIMNFTQNAYKGKLEGSVLTVDDILLETGYTNQTKFILSGEYSENFSITNSNEVVKITPATDWSIEDLEDNHVVVLEVKATGERAIAANTVVVIDIYKSVIVPPVFKKAFYKGTFTSNEGLLFEELMSLEEGFDNTVEFSLDGEFSKWFILEQKDNSINLKVNATNPIPEVVLENNAHLFFTIIASKPEKNIGRAVIYIDLPKENNNFKVLQFEQTSYVGRIEEQVLHIESIRMTEDNILPIEFIITGEYASYFRISKSSDFIQIVLIEAPTGMIDENHFIVLNLEASQLDAISGHTTIIVKIVKDDKSGIMKPIFNELYYTGEYSKENKLIFPSTITLVQGYDDTVSFELEDDDSQFFSLEPIVPNGLTLKIKNDSINEIVGRGHLIFTVAAHKVDSTSARAAIVISLLENSNVRILQFEQTSYLGNIDNKVLELENLGVLGGTTSSMEFNIIGDYASYFSISKLADSIKISLIEPPTEQFENNDFIILSVIALEPGAVSGHTTIVLNIVKKPEYNTATPVFSEAYYSGQYSEENELVFLSVITLIQGYDETVTFILDDDDSKGFVLKKNDLNNFSLVVNGSVSAPENRNYLLFTVIAQKPNTNDGRAAIVISIPGPLEIDNVSFDRVLYNGKLHNGVLSHDTITLSGFNGTNIQIIGEYKDLFKSELKNGIVKVVTTVTEFPKTLAYIALELKALSASAILLIDVSFSENPQLPVVSFKSPSYFLWADVQQTGRIGAVEATADNGEDIIYSLSDVNEQIQNRININTDGEILLIAAFDKGVYRFNAVATSTQSQVQATAPVLLRVDILPECSNEVGLSPLIILERLEEEPHLNLVVLDQTQHKGCQYTLSNVFPKDQSWLYVDNDGLHAKAIDREDKSIAFMTLSQIQVELTLDCDSDGVPALTKRSLGAEDRSDLYYYDDGPNKWVLTDTILFNARRSFVNLIVKDINDNSPIFLGKGNEPIYVGYPVSELEGTVLPRALIEVKATDADIGENAAIIYWSEEDNLAVSPNTGLVHVRNKAELENNSRLTIYAIDQNGRGRNGTIDIVVKLLDRNQIVVLTVRDAFLDDEVDVVNKLSTAVGYEIKVLKAVVISNNNEELTRKKRDVTNNSRASLQLYVYGLFESEPVDINQLTRDISNSNIATVNIDRIISLEDHLKGLEIGSTPERDLALLASTIALAVLLFIIIVAIAVWFFLKWRRSKNYEQFSNRTSTVSQLASPNIPKIEIITKPRPEIDEIKKTERRLQEMLETPVENALVQIDDDVKPPIETYDESVVNISSPDAQLPIVIQSIDKLKDNTDDSDDNDEFGEIKMPRKSVVTFNENVEKIIHIDDVPDDEESSESNYEIYKF